MADNSENIGGVSVSITGDYSELASDFDAAVALAVSKGATLAEAIQSAMEAPDTAPVTQALEGVGAAADTAASHLGTLGQQAHDTESIFQQFGEQFEAFGEQISQVLEHPIQQFRALVEAIGPVGIAIGAVVGVIGELTEKLGELVLEEGQAARDTENFALKLGITFDQAKQLSEMAQVVSVDIGGLARVSTLLAQALEDPDGSPKAAKTAQALQDMGIAATSGGDALMQLLQHLAAIEDPTQRLAEAAQIIPARMVANLSPLLTNFDAIKEAVESLGGQLDDSLVQGLLKVNEQSKLLGIAWDHLKEAFAASFAPAITDGLKVLTQMMVAAQNVNWDTVVAAFTGMSPVLGAVAALLQPTPPLPMAVPLHPETPTVTPPPPPDYSAALHAAYGQLGVTNYSSLTTPTIDTSGVTSKFSDIQAFNALVQQGTLGMQRTEQAADTLYAKLVSAYDAGAISAKTFNDTLDKINSAVADSVINDYYTNLSKWATPFDAAAGAGNSFVTTLKTIGDSFSLVDAAEAAAAPDTYAATWDVLDKSVAATGESALKMAGDLSNAVQAFVAINKAFADTNSAANITTGSLDATSTALLKAFSTTAFGSGQVADLSAAFKTLGITTDSAGGATTKLLAAYDTFSKEGVFTVDSVELAWGRVSGAVTKLAQTDLPAAEAEWNKHIAQLQAVGAAQGVILAAQESLLQLEIKTAAQSGTDATAEIIALTQKQYETKALADASTNLGTVYQGLRKDFDDAFTSVEQGLSQAIVGTKSWGQTFTDIANKIATSILDTIIKGALQPLQDSLNQTGGLFDTIAQKLTGLTKNVTGLFGGSGGGTLPLGPPGATGSVGDIAGGPNAGLPGGPLATVEGAGTAATGAAPVAGAASTSSTGAGAAGSLLGTVSSVAGIVGAAATVISGIVQGFQMAHLENLTGEIEVTTRKIFNVTGGNGDDSIYGYTHQTVIVLTEMMGQLSQLHEDNVLIMGKLDLIQAGGGGGGGTGNAADLLATLLGGMLTGATTSQQAAEGMSNAASTMTQAAVDQQAAADQSLTATSALTAISQTATNILNNPTAQPPTSYVQLAPSPTTDQLIQANVDAAKTITAALTPIQQAQSKLVSQGEQSILDSANALVLAGDLKDLSQLQVNALAIQNQTAAFNANQQFVAFAANLAANPTPVGGPQNLNQEQISQNIIAQSAGLRGQNGFTNSVPGQATFFGGPGSFQSGTGMDLGQILNSGVGSNGAAAFTTGFTQGTNSAYKPSPGESQIQFYQRSYQFSPDGSGFDLFSPFGFPTIHIGLSVPGQGQTPPTPSNLVPTPPQTLSFNSGLTGGGSIPITVNAVNPTSRSVADGIVQGLRQIGVKVA